MVDSRQASTCRVAQSITVSMATQNLTFLAIQNLTLFGTCRGGSEATGAGRPGVPVCVERSAETAREAVGWMALESSVWRRIR